MKSACEIAVIGGGLSGLAAASVLNETKKGRSVVGGCSAAGWTHSQRKPSRNR